MMYKFISISEKRCSPDGTFGYFPGQAYFYIRVLFRSVKPKSRKDLFMFLRKKIDSHKSQFTNFLTLIHGINVW